MALKIIEKISFINFIYINFNLFLHYNLVPNNQYEVHLYLFFQYKHIFIFKNHNYIHKNINIY